MASSSGTCRVRFIGVSALLAVHALACGDDAEPARPGIDAASAEATAQVDPGLICRDQLATKVTLQGEHFAVIAGDPPQRPGMTLPTVTLSRSHELDGGQVGSPEKVVYSGDPEADPTNALDEHGDPIEVDGRPLLQWHSKQEMSVLVTQSLVLGPKLEGDDTRERGSLPTGIWDVRVQNPDGQSAAALGALAVVERPKLEQLETPVVCLDQGPRTVSLRGQTLLRNAGKRAQLAIEGTDARVELELSDCTAIDHDGLDAEMCKRASATLAKGSVPPGYPALTLVNPEAAACKSEEELSLRVVPGPVIAEVIDALACIEQDARTFVIKGQHFLRLDGTKLPRVSVGDRELAVMAMECDAALPAGEHTVEQCSSLTIALKPGELDAGVYDVTVVNPDNLDDPASGPVGCSTIASNALRIAPPPSIDEAQPSYVCLDEAAGELRLHGSDFLTIDGVVPSVEVDGAVLPPSAIATEDCDAIGADVLDSKVDRCSTLVLRLGQNDVDTGNPVLKVTNPSPAGCDVEAINAWTVLPRPTVKLAEPGLICNRQGDSAIALTGGPFLDLAGSPPTVEIGEVAATSVAVVDASCTQIAGRDNARLCTELTATVPAGSLSVGLHDVVVSSAAAAGCTTQQAAELAVVDAPALATVAPDPICLAQGALRVTMTGTSFVRIGTALPAVTVGSVAASSVAVTESTCTPVTGASDAVACTELTATLAMDALAVGTTGRVVVTNPGPAGCASQEALDLQVVAPPQIASLASSVCTGGGRVSVSGANLTGLSARLVDPDTQVAIEALDTVVDAGGTQATIRFSSVVAPDTYQLVITSTSGCATTAAQSVVASAGPVLFAVDPQVGFDGAALRATLYASGLTAVPAVVLTPHGRAGAPDQHALTSVLWPDGSDNEIRATIPAGVPAGSYDVTLDFASGCDPVLAQGLRVVADAMLVLASPALSPHFGEQHAAVAVAVSAEPNADLAAGEVNFRATPRAYLWSAALSTAQPLRAVAFHSQERLTAIVPDTLAAGSYDLLVLNPDGSVGFQADAYEATAVAPPVINGVTPAQLDNDVTRTIVIAGAGFVNPATDMEVTLECLSPGAPAPTAVGPLAIDAASTANSLLATVPAGIAHGSVCVVRVTNKTNATSAELSAVTIRDPAAELPEFQRGSPLVEARRAPAAAIAGATPTARFVYAIGGDDGDAAHAKASVEAAAIDRFGEPGAFRKLTTTLPVAVTQAQAVVGGRYVYLLGGLQANATSAAIRRALVLDPSAAPQLDSVDMRFFVSPDANPATRDGLAPGAWSYAVSAVFVAGDADNPNGESLPSEPVTFYAPDVPDGVEVQLQWAAVRGADGVTEAAAYRIYRTTEPYSAVSSLRLLAQVASPVHTFVDRNPGALLDPDQQPLAVGDLGEWRTLPATLNSARAAYGLALANDSNCDPFVYVVGGRVGADRESATYEYASFDPSTGALGAFTQATGTALTARRELAVFVADDRSSSQIDPTLGCESYLYAAHGRSGAAGFVTSVQEAAVQPGGALGAFSASGPSAKSVAGHAAFFSADGAYVLGGASDVAAATRTALQADICTGSGCTAPNLQSFSSASNDLLDVRYLAGFARDGALLYLVGGAGDQGEPLASSERNVR